MLRRKIKHKFVERRQGDPAILVASYDRAKNQLKWDPKHSGLDEVVSSMWEHYKK